MADHERAQRFGVQISYDDALGKPRTAPDEVVEAVVGALDRGEGRNGPDTDRGPVFVPEGTTALPERVTGASLVLEDGTELGHVGELPPDLPPGYHRLSRADARELLV